MNFKYNSERQRGKHIQLFILHMWIKHFLLLI